VFVEEIKISHADLLYDRVDCGFKIITQESVKVREVYKGERSKFIKIIKSVYESVRLYGLA
jgi:hypothetical protein